MLLGQVDELAAHVVRRIWGVVPGYEAPRLRRSDLEAAVAPNLRTVLEHVVDPDRDDSSDHERAAQLGASRALQGVPLDVVVQSFHTAEREMADAFVSHGEELDAAEIRVGLRRLAQGFDLLTGATVDAYRQTQHEITAHYERVAGDLVAGLVSGEVDVAQVEEQARVLDCDVDAACQAVALSLEPTDDLPAVVGAQRALLAVLAPGRSGRILVGKAGGADLFVVPGELGPDDVARVTEQFDSSSADVTVTLGSVSARLTDAGRSCREALAALDVVRSRSGHGVVTHYDDVLLDIMVLGSHAVGDRLVDRFLTPVLGHPHLLETIEGYVNHHMSTRDTAAALYVHPNTVSYRLDRIRELTGADPRRPRELLLLWLASKAAAG